MHDVLAGGRPQDLRVAELVDLQPAVVEHQVSRVEIEMLHVVLQVQVIEHLRRGANIIDQFAARNARLLRVLSLAALLEAILQAALGELRDNQQLSFDHLDPLKREQKGMSDAFYAIERL